ncbi:NUDIX hydrolase [Fluviispira multicolorata]|uniref:NUDIX domain-containing protein n=1 Tax=Fluviispira multicolorata TaxID=2654512 RepID=A0A833N3E7_9BACT|nr:CoA pyrophosphatase [Fluviispira multicolorata]KAB8028458.1 NUDIX domain-containing protein [Fluviispira multicolorata]
MGNKKIVKFFQKIGEAQGLLEDIPKMTRRSAIMIPILCPESDWHNDIVDIKNWSLLFTIRSKNLKEHAGEVSFPGGRIEENESPYETALRECDEEIGLKKENIIATFQLNNSFARSGYHIVPFCSLVSNSFKLKMNADEVSETVTLTIQDILNIEAWSEIRTLATFKREVWHYPIEIKNVGFFDIWGATGNILKDLMLRIEKNI